MELSVETLEGGLRCVHLAGRLDLKGTQEVDLKFTGHVAGAKTSVVVDLSKVEFIASIGIRMLLSNVKVLNTVAARMVLLNPQKLVEDVLKLSGLDSVTPIARSEQEAIQIIKSAPVK